MEALVKQATDSQYLDIWNRQVIQLERHLNTLELERFGDESDIQLNRKSFYSKHNPPTVLYQKVCDHKSRVWSVKIARAMKMAVYIKSQSLRFFFKFANARKVGEFYGYFGFLEKNWVFCEICL